MVFENGKGVSVLAVRCNAQMWDMSTEKIRVSVF